MTEAWDVGQVAIAGVMALIIGYGGGMVGDSGSPMFIALLVFMCDMKQSTANGTVLAMMLGPMTFLGCVVMKDRIKVLFQPIAFGVAGYSVFTYFGALTTLALSPSAVRFSFGLLLFVLSAITLWPMIDKQFGPFFGAEDEAAANFKALDKSLLDDDSLTSWAQDGVEDTRQRSHTSNPEAISWDGAHLNPNGPTVLVGAQPILALTPVTMMCLGAVFGFIGGMFGLGTGVLMNCASSVLFR